MGRVVWDGRQWERRTRSRLSTDDTTTNATTSPSQQQYEYTVSAPALSVLNSFTSLEAEVEVEVAATPGIPFSLTVRTARTARLPCTVRCVHTHILVHTQQRPAHATQYCRMIPLVAWPNGVWMVRCDGLLLMARVARIEELTAVHLDGHHIAWAVPVYTARLIVDGLSVHVRVGIGHSSAQRRRRVVTMLTYMKDVGLSRVVMLD